MRIIRIMFMLIRVQECLSDDAPVRKVDGLGVTVEDLNELVVLLRTHLE